MLDTVTRISTLCDMVFITERRDLIWDGALSFYVD